MTLEENKELRSKLIKLEMHKRKMKVIDSNLKVES